MEDEDKKRWQAFALKTREFSSKYLTSEDRRNMINSLYMQEKGEGIAKNYIFENIAKNLSSVILTKQKDYPWGNFTKNFTNREADDDFEEIIARDLLLIEHTQKMFEKIRNKQIDEKYESRNTLDMESFKLAKFLDDLKYQNYIV